MARPNSLELLEQRNELNMAEAFTLRQLMEKGDTFYEAMDRMFPGIPMGLADEVLENTLKSFDA